MVGDTGDGCKARYLTISARRRAPTVHRGDRRHHG